MKTVFSSSVKDLEASSCEGADWNQLNKRVKKRSCDHVQYIFRDSWNLSLKPQKTFTYIYSIFTGWEALIVLSELKCSFNDLLVINKRLIND